VIAPSFAIEALAQRADTLNCMRTQYIVQDFFREALLLAHMKISCGQ
jgi:hypothetical protein